ncbi:MAG: hypothetical protein KKA19_06445 [Candidatus Margulisbacteria bacterium]|nr:hypothetical protein [Candidatus Margulisiibacteriota bacterium]
MGEEGTIIDWILTANGPGEIAAHVKPIADEIRRQNPEARITLIILPCQFASGHERAMSENISSLDKILMPNEYRELIFKKKKYEEFQKLKKGVILYLGGDPFHALLLKNRFKYPAFAYAEKEIRWANKFIEVFTPHNTGNLMVDAADDDIFYAGHALHDKKLTVALFPGSRPGYVEYMIPFLIKVTEKLKKQIPKIKFCWGVPVHLKKFVLEKFPDQISKYPDIKECKGIDLMLTLLGTNTALYAVKGIPMLVLFPFQRPDLVPLMGLLGIIAKIPFLGWFIKWLALKIAAFRLGYVAIPNIASKAEITPELKGNFLPEDVANKAHELLKDLGWRNRISGQLRFSIGKAGAAKKIVERIKTRIR